MSVISETYGLSSLLQSIATEGRNDAIAAFRSNWTVMHIRVWVSTFFSYEKDIYDCVDDYHLK